jgi:hypothetical protein
MHALTGAQMDAQFLSSRAQEEHSISPTHVVAMILVIETSKSSMMGNGGHRRCGIVLIEFFIKICCMIAENV